MGAIGLLAAGLVWIATGFRAVSVLAQRGHDLGPCARLGIALGPLLAGWALWAVRRRQASVEFIEVAAGERGRGSLSIVIAVLGEPERVAAADALLGRLRDDIDEIVLLGPVNPRGSYDRGGRTVAAAVRRLSRAALFVSEPQPRLVLATGPGVTAVNQFIVDHRPGVVIVVANAGRHHP